MTDKIAPSTKKYITFCHVFRPPTCSSQCTPPIATGSGDKISIDRTMFLDDSFQYLNEFTLDMYVHLPSSLSTPCSCMCISFLTPKCIESQLHMTSTARKQACKHCLRPKYTSGLPKTAYWQNDPVTKKINLTRFNECWMFVCEGKSIYCLDRCRDPGVSID